MKTKAQGQPSLGFFCSRADIWKWTCVADAEHAVEAVQAGGDLIVLVDEDVVPFRPDGARGTPADVAADVEHILAAPAVVIAVGMTTHRPRRVGHERLTFTIDAVQTDQIIPSALMIAQRIRITATHVANDDPKFLRSLLLPEQFEIE